MKVCFLAGTLGRGGAERQLVYMIRALTAAGVSVRVLSLTQGEALQPEIEALGVPVTWVGRSSTRLARTVEIARELRRDPPDVVQCVQLYVNLYAAMAARASGSIDIGAVRTDLTQEDLAGAWWLLGRLSLRLPRFVIANSRAGVEAARRHTRSRDAVMLLPNVVDTDRFHPPASRAGGETVRILCLGRLHRQKRVDRFLRAAAEVERRLPGRAEFWIAGSGALRAELEAQAAQLELPRVRFLGEHPNSAELLREVDVLALTSDWEGQPNVVLEAMSTALPVVSTRLPGVEEVMPAGAGLVVDPEDEAGLADALARVVSEPALRAELGQHGLAHVRNNLSTRVLADQMLGLYDRMMRPR